LPTVESDDGSLTSLASAMPTGRAAAYASASAGSSPATQVDPNNNPPSASGLRYLASTGLPSLSVDPTAAPADDVQTANEPSSDAVAPASITAGGMSVEFLLSSPTVSIRTDPANLEQVAELIPLANSSLALAAALWTVPSDAPADSNQAGSSSESDATREPAAPAVAYSKLAAYLTGADKSFERTLREFKENITSSDVRIVENATSRNASNEVLDWQPPILPGAERGSSAEPERSTERSRDKFIDESLDVIEMAPVQPPVSDVTRDAGPQPETNKGRPVIIRIAPMVSVASISTLAAGWFWSGRKARRLSSPRSRIPKKE
jgi:hypothetical protein